MELKTHSIIRNVAICVSVSTVIIIVLVIVLSNNYVTTDDIARCHSLGGTYSAESRKCYYAGKPNDMDELKKELGL